MALTAGRQITPRHAKNSQGAAQMARDFSWPPEVGKRFPKAVFIDPHGTTVEMEQLQGRILLIEPIGMPCEACQAFVGGHEHGGFGGVQPQQNLPPIKELARTYGNFDLDDPRILKVQMLLFNMNLKMPTEDDAKRWSDHFGVTGSAGHLVLAGNGKLVDKESFRRIPGFWLVDEGFVVQADSTGHDPQHDLYEELLPMLGRMLETPAIH